MKKLLQIIALFVSSCICSYAQTPMWENLFPDNRGNVTLLKTLDGNLITSGIQYGPVLYPSNIAKYDLEGNLLWKRKLRILKTGEEDLQQTPDGNYLFTGSVNASAANTYLDTYLQQLDENGDTTNTWARTYGMPQGEYPTEMILLDGGDILIAGQQTWPSYYTLRRTDSLGNTIWHKKYAYSINTYGTRMIRNRNGNLVLLGMVATPITYVFHPYLIEVNTNGDSLRSQFLVLTDTTAVEETNRMFNNLIQTSDGGYAFGGVFSSNGYIAKTDSLFNLLWYYEIPSMQASSQQNITAKIIELQDSTLLFMSKDNDPAANAFYLTRLSKDGDSISTTAIQSDVCPGGNMLPYNWQFLADSSIVICGWCVSNQQAYIGRWGNLNFPLPMGFFPDTATVSAPEALTHHKASLGQSYPNPTTNTATIPYTLPNGVHTANIELRDLVTGRSISKYNLPTNEGAAELPVTLSNVAAGVYVYTLTINGNPAGTKKMVLTR